jgi:uncharacterized protein
LRRQMIGATPRSRVSSRRGCCRSPCPSRTSEAGILRRRAPAANYTRRMDSELSGRTLRGEPLRCPVDGSRLVQVDRSEILIDACPECRGVWLDRGELDRILVKERQMSGRDPDEDFFREVEGRREERGRRPVERHHRDDDYRPRRRKRSLLEDLLDFD